MKAESFESVDKSSGGADGIEPVEVIVSQIEIWGAGAQDVVCDNEDFVSDRDYRFGPSAARLDSEKQSSQITLFAA